VAPKRRRNGLKLSRPVKASMAEEPTAGWLGGSSELLGGRIAEPILQIGLSQCILPSYMSRTLTPGTVGIPINLPLP
jgi:hypothetical protein